MIDRASEELYRPAKLAVDIGIRNAAFRDVVDGLISTHNRTDASMRELHQTASTVAALVELLVEQGLIDQAELERRRSEIAVELRRLYVARGMTVAVQASETSKYAFTGVTEIDCASRLHLCKAACCRLSFALSREDVEEGIVRWDFAEPYMIARNDHGYCAHTDSKTYSCTVYDQRPVTCRGYDCRGDERIWMDFDRMQINPSILDSGWPDYADEPADAIEQT